MKQLFEKIKIFFIKWWIKSEKRVAFAFSLWANWSNFYQILERKFMTIHESKLRKWFDDKKKSRTLSWADDPTKSWHQYCLDNKLSHYDSDPWYMGWDVVSAPERFIARKQGDCDDYALLAYDYFQNYINEGDVIYEFLGFYSIVWEDGSGHAISVWKNMYKPKSYLMATNDELILVRNFISYWDNVHGGVKWVGKFSISHLNKIKFIGMVDEF